MNKEYQEIIVAYNKLQIQYKRPLSWLVQIKNKALFDKIIKVTSFLKPTAKFKERLYYIFHNITEPILCEVCHKNPVLWSGGNNAPSRCCSNKCNNQSEHKKNATKNTCIQKYGVENPYQSNEIKLKCKQTKLNKYGDEEYRNIDKMKKTKSTKEWKEKNRPKYRNMWKNKTPEEMKQKKLREKATKKEKYGNENYCNVEKAKQTKLLKYGNEKYINVKKKIAETTFKHYGVSSYLILTHKSTISKLNKRIFKILNKHHIYFISEFPIETKSYDIKFNNNVILEINGDFWHANPKIYQENDILNMPKGKKTAKECWEYDTLKYNIAKQHGYDVKYIWEYDMKYMTDEQIFDFIKTTCLNI